MSVQLLDKTRKINKLLHNNNSSKVVFNDICQVLTEILDSNILVISRKGKVLGVSLCPGVEEIKELIDDEVGGYIDSMLNVAEQFPNSSFMHCSGYKTAPNMSNYFGRIYQARYLTGLVAGSMTQSNVIGYVAAFPLPEVIRGINAFTLGVRAVNPKAEVRVVWTKSWYDPAMEKSVAKNLIKEGADVIAQHQDSSGPQEAAQEQGTYSIGYNTDMSRVAPRAHMTSAIWSWNPAYENVVEQVRAGTWKNGSFWYGMETGVVDIAPYGPMVPQNVRDLTEAAKADIKSGKLVVFTGPIKDQKGVERIPTGMVPSDKELLGMDWFVEGVIGTID